MVGISNEHLKKTLGYLLTIENVIDREKRRIDGEKDHLDNIVPEYLKKTYSRKKVDADAFAKRLYQITYDSHVIILVSAFENVVFAKYQTSYGGIKSTVRDHTNKPMDYYMVREKFVNDSIDKLAGIINLIEGHLAAELLEDLNRIKKQRDFIAHGKRFNEKSPSVDMKIEDIAKVLDKVITEIEN